MGVEVPIDPDISNKNRDLIEKALLAHAPRKCIADACGVDDAALSRLYSESSLDLLCASLSYMGIAMHPARNVSVDPDYLRALETVAKEEIRP